MSRIHNLSRFQRAQALKEGMERIARGIEIEHDDPDDDDARDIAEVVRNFGSRLKTMSMQAAAGWQPAFGRVLASCHSMRIKKVDKVFKEGVRTDKLRCMACGRFERRCPNVIDLAGKLDGDAFLGPIDGIPEAYDDFKEDYASVYEKDFVECVECDDLPPQDLGGFTVGMTCMRKAQLFYQTRTLLLELVYDADRQIENIEKTTGQKVSEHKLHTVGDERVHELMRKVEQLELAIADESRRIPPLETDCTYWQRIDEAREAACDGSERSMLKLLRLRALSSLGLDDDEGEDGEDDEDEDDLDPRPGPSSSSRRSGGGDEDDEEDDQEFEGCDDEEEEEEQCSRQPLQMAGRSRRLGKAAAPRSRTNRIVDDDSDSDAGAEPPAYQDARAASSSSKRPATRGSARVELKRRKGTSTSADAMVSTRRSTRAPTPVHTPAPAQPAPPLDDDVDDVAAPAAAGPSQSAAPAADLPPSGAASSSAQFAPRVPPASAVAMAQTQRISGTAGRLPARRAAVLALMDLQVRLMRAGDDTGAAACTSAIFVMQELLARVEQLSHTV